MSASSWLDDLESRLESTFEAFLRANPGQDTLLQEQEARDRQQRLRRQRLELQGQAELGRRRLAAGPLWQVPVPQRCNQHKPGQSQLG